MAERRVDLGSHTLLPAKPGPGAMDTGAGAFLFKMATFIITILGTCAPIPSVTTMNKSLFYIKSMAEEEAMAPTKVIWRIIKFFFRKIPIESAFSSLAYILENLHPAVMTMLSAALFEAAEGCLTGNGQTTRLYVYTIYIILYFVMYNIVRSPRLPTAPTTRHTIRTR